MTLRSSALVVLRLMVSAVVLHAQQKPGKDRHVITQEELESTNPKTTYEAVRNLRPLWLSNHGVSGLFDTLGQVVTKETGMAVYVDGHRRGGLTELLLIPMATVHEIRRLSVDEAVIRYGADLPFGTIEVIQKK